MKIKKEITQSRTCGHSLSFYFWYFFLVSNGFDLIGIIKKHWTFTDTQMYDSNNLNVIFIIGQVSFTVKGWSACKSYYSKTHADFMLLTRLSVKFVTRRWSLTNSNYLMTSKLKVLQSCYQLSNWDWRISNLIENLQFPSIHI